MAKDSHAEHAIVKLVVDLNFRMMYEQRALILGRADDFPRETGTSVLTITKPVWDFGQIRHCVPAAGYIRDYVEYAIQCTDAPPLYHILAATAVVSAAISPHVDLIFQEEIHPLHLFILLVGDSSESRKTSAIKRAVRVAEPVFGRQSGLGDRLWWPTISSPEGIIEELIREPNRLMLLSEWTDMQRLSGRAGYWQHGQELWNLVYDAQDMVRARSKEKRSIQRPRVTILGASTPSLIDHATQPIDWDGGKMARYLMGCMTRPDGKFMEASLDLPDLVSKLRGRLSELISSRPPTYGAGPVTISPGAWDLMRAWQRDDWWLDLKARAPRHLKPSFARAPEHLFRISSVYACSMSYPFKVVVDVDCMQAAIKLTEWCFDSMVSTMSLLSSDEGTPIAKVLAVLAASGTDGATRASLLKATGVTSRQLNEALGTLGEREELKSRNAWSADGRAQTRYVYTPAR